MITIAIPTFNRDEYVIESIKNVVGNEFISEICVVDDFSNPDIYSNLISLVDSLKNNNSNYEKIKIYQNERNLGGFLNKVECVRKSSNDWVILLDSDNIIDNDYIDIVNNLKDESTIYSPSNAICEFNSLNYTEYAGTILDKESYKKAICEGGEKWKHIFNTGNFYFNKNSYLECVDSEDTLESPLAADVSYLNFLWFKNKKDAKFMIVDKLKYWHRVHTNSYWHTTSGLSDQFLKSIYDKIKQW